jgi:hypothetical protein
MGEPRSHAVRSSLPLVKLGWLSRAESGEFVLTASGRALIDQAEGLAEKAAASLVQRRRTQPDRRCSRPWPRPARLTLDRCERHGRPLHDPRLGRESSSAAPGGR